MKRSGGDFEQCYNAQIAVDTDTMLVVGAYACNAVNDKQQIAPMLAELKAVPAALGRVKALLGDTGFYSEHNVDLCEQESIDAYLAVGRDPHHPNLFSRFCEPDDLPENATVRQKMQHKLKTKVGRAVYAVRKCTVEPVFGIIKTVI